MKSQHELNVVDIRRFELYARVGISHVALDGGYAAVRAYYEKKTGRSFDKDMELAKKSAKLLHGKWHERSQCW